MEANATTSSSSPLLTALNDSEFLPWLLERLLLEEQFSDQWLQQVIDKVDTQTAPPNEADSHQLDRIEHLQTAVRSRVPRLCNPTGEPRENLVTVVKELRTSVNLTTESFLAADKPAINVSSTTSMYGRHNRDAATLFAARRIVEDLLLSTLGDDRVLVRSAAFGRRLSGLCRLLADRLANADVDQLPHVHSFAHSLHEMLVRFDEHLNYLLVNANCAEDLRRLRIAIDQFQSNVVVQLQTYANEWKVLHQQTLAKCLSDRQTPSSTTVTVRHIRSDFNPKGYLLPVPLREKRRMVGQNLFVNPQPVTHVRSMTAREKKHSGRQRRNAISLMATVDRIESRWKELLNSDIQQVLVNSIQQPATVSHHAYISQHLQPASKDAETSTSDRFSSWLQTARDPANRLAQKIIENAVDLIIQDIDNACDQIVENIFAEEMGR